MQIYFKNHFLNIYNFLYLNVYLILLPIHGDNYGKYFNLLKLKYKCFHAVLLAIQDTLMHCDIKVLAIIKNECICTVVQKKTKHPYLFQCKLS